MDFISTAGDLNIKAAHGGVVRVVAFDESGYGKELIQKLTDALR